MESTTETYLSHISAACAWDIPYLHVVLGYPSVEQMKTESQKKVQRTCFSPNPRIKLASVEAHYRALALPAEAVVEYNGEPTASPELIFLELARQLGFHRAVLLGMQMCASGPDRHKPLSSAKEIRRFLGKCHGHHGLKAAIQAAQYIVDNSWSVMESLLHMHLTLPNHYGGYGLKGAVLNHEIKLRRKGVATNTCKYFADLYWEQAKLVVEYDSYEFHNMTNMWVKDARRLTTLERSGFKTLAINTAQLYSDSAFTEAAQVIARYLGKRIQVRATDFENQKRMLRGLLPRREALVE